MKIVFPSSYFYPEQPASSFLMDNKYHAFAENGFDMVVYTPVPSRGISVEERHKYSKIKTEKMYDGKMIVHRFNLLGEKEKPLNRAARYGLNIIKLFNRLLFDRDAKTVDLVYVGSTPPVLGAACCVAKRIKKVPMVFILQDIFPDSLVGTGLAKKDGILWKIGRKIEDFTYRHADKIIVISEDFKKNIMAKGVPEDKIVVIYNWVDQNAVVELPREENKLFDKYGLDRSKFYIEYSGNIGLTQNMDMLLEVMKELKVSHPDIGLVLVGEGAYKQQVEEIVKRDALSNVAMLPFQPYEDISHVFSLGDAGLVISKPGVGANSVPSKTWSIMSASRPVLANFDENELKTIVEDHQCGIFTKAGDKEAFKQSILTLYNNRELCKEYGRNGRQFVMDNLTKEVGTQKYVEVIKSFEKTK